VSRHGVDDAHASEKSLICGDRPPPDKFRQVRRLASRVVLRAQKQPTTWAGNYRGVSGDELATNLVRPEHLGVQRHLPPFDVTNVRPELVVRDAFCHCLDYVKSTGRLPSVSLHWLCTLRMAP
jgi:hypothetical protein